MQVSLWHILASLVIIFKHFIIGVFIIASGRHEIKMMAASYQGRLGEILYIIEPLHRQAIINGMYRAVSDD